VLGLAVKRLRSTGSCVATPTGQVLRWHLRIMMQPAAIKGAVANPNSSAPSNAPITTVASGGRKPAIDLHHDAAAPTAHAPASGGVRRGRFPRGCGMLDRGQGRGAGAAFEAGNGDVIGRALSQRPRRTVPTPISETSFTDTCRPD